MGVIGIISAVILFLGKIMIAAGATVITFVLVMRDDQIHYIAIPLLVSPSTVSIYYH